MTWIEVKNVTMRYDLHEVLKDFSLEVREKELLAITGPSGSGKSTILNILGLLLEPTKGEKMHFGEKNIKVNSSKALWVLRYGIGYLFQNYALIDEETVMKNMSYAVKFSVAKDKKKEIYNALDSVGLGHMKERKVYTLSGGEQQRLAVARLLVKPCKVILADEPTGNLDEDNQQRIMELFGKFIDAGKSVVVVTHATSILSQFDRVIRLEGF